MRRKTMFVILSWLSSSAFLLCHVLAQEPSSGQAHGAAAQASVCKPTAQSVAQGGGARVPGAAGQGQQGLGPATQQPPRDLTITALPGVGAAGGKWTKIWQAAGNSADGILADKDGRVLVAQEDFDTVLEIDGDGKSSVAVANAKGVGFLSMDRQGRAYGAHRTERPGSTKPDQESIVNSITMLAPERKTITDKWADGTPLTVRPNDLLADGTGGAYFTVGCLYYATPKGVTVAADNIRTNGIAFSPDDRSLYVTNGGTLVAFDVDRPGQLTNRRDFAMLTPGSSGDGTAVDSQ